MFDVKYYISIIHIEHYLQSLGFLYLWIKLKNLNHYFKIFNTFQHNFITIYFYVIHGHSVHMQHKNRMTTILIDHLLSLISLNFMSCSHNYSVNSIAIDCAAICLLANFYWFFTKLLNTINDVQKCQKLKYVLLNWYSAMKKRSILILKVKCLALFDTSPLHQFSKFNMLIRM